MSKPLVAGQTAGRPVRRPSAQARLIEGLVRLGVLRHQRPLLACLGGLLLVA